jgi:hypothetical protein
VKAWLQKRWPYVLGMLAIAVVVLFFFLKRSSSSSGAGTISFPGNSVSGGLSPSSTPTPSSVAQGFFGLIRGQGAVPGWDAVHQGIPFWSSMTQAGNPLSFIPWGSQVQILGTSQGPPDAASGTTTWYQISWGGVTGWINAFDLGNFLGDPTGLPSLLPSSHPLPPIGPVPGSSAIGGGGRNPLAGLARHTARLHASSTRIGMLNPALAQRYSTQAAQGLGERARVMTGEARGMAPIGLTPLLRGKRTALRP